MAILWDVHGETAEGKYPADNQALQLCAQNVHFHQNPLWSQGELTFLPLFLFMFSQYLSPAARRQRV